MNTLHVKSPCCLTRIRRFGHKRRQCCRCKRTWTIRPKKRGRPHARLPSNILKLVFLQGFTPQLLGYRNSRLSLPTFRYRFRQALRRFVERSSPQKVPNGPLILLADGIHFNFRNSAWVLYLTAFKSCSESRAVFLDPILLPGQEGASKWKKVFAAIPPAIRQQVCALVVDNLNGMKKLSKHYHWTLQLCHFHLFLKLQVRIGKQCRALIAGGVRQELYRLIRQAIETTDYGILHRCLSQLDQMSKHYCGTQRMESIVRDFLKSVSYFRAYITHPDLHLPSTTNTVESMGALLRDLLRRNRSASNPKSLLYWTTALIRLRPYIKCNGKISTD